MRISTRFILSLSIVFLGYLTTLVVSHTLGIRTQKQLDYAVRHLFPAVIESRKAKVAFEKHYKCYQDAVVFGDVSLLANGKKAENEMLDALNNLIKRGSLSKEMEKKVNILLDGLSSWSNRADKVYRNLAGEDMDMALRLMEDSRLLNQAHLSLYDELNDLVASLTESLTSKHDEIIRQTRIQGHSNLGLFCVVIVFSSIAMVVLLRKIVGPIQKLAETAQQIQAGDLGRRAEVKNKDEIGELGNAFNSMTEKLARAVSGLEAEVVERKRAQEEVARHRDNLEEIVKERTSELSTALESLSRLKTAIEQSMDGIAVNDTEGNVLFINDALAKMHGLEISEVVGKNFLNFFNDKRLADEAFMFNKQVIQEGSFEGEVKHLRKDGIQFPTWMSGTLLKDSEDNTTGVVTVTRDITDQKKAEAELESVNKQLVESAHKAGMADIAAGTLHNVGNILNSVKTSAQMISDIANKSKIDGLIKANNLLRTNIDTLEDFILSNPKGKKLMQYYLKLEELIEDEQNYVKSHVTRLIDKINVITEVISAQQSYAGTASLSEEYSLSEIVEDALTMQQGTTERYSINVVKDFRNMKKVKVQKSKLVHILINLIRNAKDAMLEMPPTKRTIQLTVDSENGAAFIKVKDSGQGISEKGLSKIFTHGFTTKKDGHGFGLHSSANYMTEMDGEMWAESEGEGKGATFVLKFQQN